MPYHSVSWRLSYVLFFFGLVVLAIICFKYYSIRPPQNSRFAAVAVMTLNIKLQTLISLCEKALLPHSVRKDWTGLAIAAFTTCKQIVAIAIITATTADKAKTHQLILIL